MRGGGEEKSGNRGKIKGKPKVKRTWIQRWKSSSQIVSDRPGTPTDNYNGAPKDRRLFVLGAGKDRLCVNPILRRNRR